MEKITEYNKLIGKEISKIEEDGFQVRIYFADNSYTDIIGASHGGFVSICEYEGEKDEIIGASTHKQQRNGI